MDTLDFLQRVLPSKGYYCGGLVTEEGEFKQRFYSTLEDLRDFSLIVSERNCNSYFAISSFAEKGSRKKDNILACKLFALDIDVGKVDNSYPDRQTALTALGEFIDKKQLPKPMIVSSGAGFHVYWVFKEEIDYDKWLPIATALKTMAISSGLTIDPVVTADAARVLRAVGTVHVKTGKTVKVILDAEPIELSELKNKLGNLHSFAPRKHNLLDKMSVKKEYPPAAAGVVSSKCAQIAWAIKNPTEVPEPFWYTMLGVAAHTVDPPETAKAWSSGHPDYKESDALAKLEQWKNNTTGPATCQAFQNLRPKGCAGCVFAGKIVTPAALGATYQEVEVTPDAPHPVPSILPVPRPFKRTTDGIKITIQDTDIDVCPFDLYPLGYGRDETLGYETVRFNWNRPHKGWSLLTFRQSMLTDGHRDFASIIADQGIVLKSRKQTELFQMLLRNYMDELRRTQTLSNLYASMGWKEDFNSFVLGDTVVKKDDTGYVKEETTTLSSGTARTSSDMFGTAGTLDEWVNGTEVLEQADMPWHMFALGVGWAAPLFAFTGLKGMTVSLYGPTGGGKTLIQYWIQSIYGDPDKLHFAAKFTQNTLFSRLGMYSNLPMTIDEATMFHDKEVGDFLYWVSQGRDKARLTRSAEEREAKTWATPVIVSTNVSLQSKLINSGLDTDAQTARLLEIPIPSHKLFQKTSTAGQKIYDHLMANYGTAGRVYIAELVRLGEAGIKAIIEKARAEFPKKYNTAFSGEERYWEQVIILSAVGQSIAKRLGLIKYDYEKGIVWALEQVGAVRKSIAEAKTDSFDIVAEYLNDNASNSVVITHTAGKPSADMFRIPHGEIRVRFELHRKTLGGKFDHGILLVDRTHFRKWLSSKGYDYKTLVNEMLSTGADATPASKRSYLGRDTPIKLAQVYVVGFNLAHARFSGVLSDVDDSVWTGAQEKLKLVASN